LIIGKIVEVEAYCERDSASHTFHGRSNRNEVMFGEGGHLYVYFTYGMHFCSNVVTGAEGAGEAVLIRAVEPLTGIEVMTKNRQKGRLHLSDGVFLNRADLINLTNGPAKFCQAFGITRKENGADLCQSKESPARDRHLRSSASLATVTSTIFIIDGTTIPLSLTGRSARIGIRTALDKKWRFFVKGNPWVSR